ncbi:YcxB family protein [Chenggangzhangella methanolivorans]|uniref:YcxB family protein n=1 Tax=Chenggangzhangella methanolivorans TaxID=1437009 RepID=UPI00360EB14F
MNRTTTFTLAERDLRRALRLHMLAMLRQPRKLFALVAIWLVATAAIAGAYHLGGTPWPELRDSLPKLAALAAVGLLVLDVAVPLLLGARVISKRFQQDKLLVQPITASWDEEAYEAVQPSMRNRIAWRDYAMLREDRHAFVFFLSDYQYQVLPKRALSDEQVADIRGIVSAV